MSRQPISSADPESIDECFYGMLATQIAEYAIFLVDESGIIASWNPGVGKILQYSRSEFVGQPFASIFTSEDRSTEQPQTELKRAYETGMSDDVRWHVRRDGSRFWCDGLVYALKDDDGQFLGYAKIMRDATPRKRAEDGLRQNSERLEAALLASNTGTFRWEIATDKLVADENFHRLFRLPPGAPVESWSGLSQMVHPDDRSRVSSVYQTAAESTGFESEFRVITPEGAVRWIYIKAKFISANSNQPRYVSGAAMDITFRKEAEAERERILAQSARRTAQLNAILASMPDGVYFGDANGINECNDRAVQMLGLGRKEDLDHPVTELMAAIQTRFADTNEPIPFDSQPFIRALRGESCVEEVSTRRVDTGEEVIVRSAAAPVRLDGKVVGAVAVNADITHEKQIEREREQLLAALRHSNDELSQFAYVVSHDLQAPLRAVTSFAQLLERRYGKQLDGDAHSIIGSILEGTQNMSQLIQAVLQYARAGQQSPALQPISLAAVIDAVLLSLSQEIKDTGAQVKCVTEMPVVETDWVQISQVFQNLIGNALRYRRRDVPALVNISARTEEAEWVIAVEDNGIGIEPAYFERVFEPLKRLHGREIPGTGIGLAICKKVLERFGGRIWLESQLGVGSKFLFTLPR